MITSEQLKTGIGNYLQKRLMPKLDGKRQFLVGTMYGLSAGKADALIAGATKHPIVRMLGVVHENGEIDIDALFEAAYAQMQAQQNLRLDIPLMGTFVFNADDLRELHQEIIGG